MGFCWRIKCKMFLQLENQLKSEGWLRDCSKTKHRMSESFLIHTLTHSYHAQASNYHSHTWSKINLGRGVSLCFLWNLSKYCCFVVVNQDTSNDSFFVSVCVFVNICASWERKNTRLYLSKLDHNSPMWFTNMICRYDIYIYIKKWWGGIYQSR